MKAGTVRDYSTTEADRLIERGIGEVFNPPVVENAMALPVAQSKAEVVKRRKTKKTTTPPKIREIISNGDNNERADSN
jgi:hypothetical protein